MFKNKKKLNSNTENEELIKALSEVLSELKDKENELNGKISTQESLSEKFLPIIVHAKVLLSHLIVHVEADRQIHANCEILNTEHVIEKENKNAKKELASTLKSFVDKLKSGDTAGMIKGKVTDGASKVISSDYDPYVVLLQSVKEIQKKQKDKKLKGVKDILASKNNQPKLEEVPKSPKLSKIEEKKIEEKKIEEKKIESKPISKNAITNVKQLSQEEGNAFEWYTDDNYVNINKAMRGIETATPKNQQYINTIKDVLDKCALDRDITLYRGTSKFALGKHFKLSVSELIGKTIVEKAFMSTTQSLYVLKRSFSKGDLVITIHAKKGAKGLDISSLSIYEAEKEVLFNAGQKMLITDAKYDKDIKIGETILHITTLLK